MTSAGALTRSDNDGPLAPRRAASLTRGDLEEILEDEQRFSRLVTPVLLGGIVVSYLPMLFDLPSTLVMASVLGGGLTLLAVGLRGMWGAHHERMARFGLDASERKILLRAMKHAERRLVLRRDWNRAAAIHTELQRAAAPDAAALGPAAIRPDERR